MAYNTNLGYDPGKDYSLAIKNSSSEAERAQLREERKKKVEKQYGGVDPYKGSSNITGSGSSGSTSGYMQHNSTDKATLTAEQLDRIAALRTQANSGQISWSDANEEANRIRAGAGYSVDKTGAVTQINPQVQVQSFPDWIEQQGYGDYSDATKAAVQAAVDKAVGGYQAQIDTANQDSDKLAKQAYIAKMLGQKNLSQQLDAEGYGGGMADQAKIQTETDYQNNLNDIELQRQSTVKELELAIRDAQLTGDMQTAQELQSYLQQMQSQWQSYVQNQNQLNSSNYWNQQSLGADQKNTAYSKAIQLLQSGVMPSQTVLNAAGLSAAEAAAMRSIYTGTSGGTGASKSTGSPGRAKSSGSTRAFGSTGRAKSVSGYSNGSLTADQVKHIQKYLGVTADGLWGAGSSAAAGGMTADEAWAALQAKAGNSAALNAQKSEAEFTRDASSVAAQLASGNADSIKVAQATVNRIWPSLSEDQKKRLTAMTAAYGY